MYEKMELKNQYNFIGLKRYKQSKSYNKGVEYDVGRYKK
jgi:hypothetical protein